MPAGSQPAPAPQAVPVDINPDMMVDPNVLMQQLQQLFGSMVQQGQFAPPPPPPRHDDESDHDEPDQMQ
jgi:hypothetical protein